MTSLKIDAEKRLRVKRRAISNNRETVQAYERCARDYAKATAPQTPASTNETLHRFVQGLEPGSSVLELGSGPGWDADFLEAQGLRVRRTDICETFLAFQHERGKTAERLDIIADALGGPFDSIVALYVLQHLDRSLMPAILQKVALSLRPGGVFLMSLQEGTGDVRQLGDSSGTVHSTFHIARWASAAFSAQLHDAGFSVAWLERSTDSEGDWLTVLAQL